MSDELKPQERGNPRTAHQPASEELSFSLQQLYEIICSRREASPENSYTASLFAKGDAKISQKVGEEATEVIVAALAQSRERVIEETADLLYHTLVLLAAKNIALDEIVGELARRHR